MRNPEYVLNSLAHKSGDPDYKFQRIYRNLYNRQFYYLAYRKLSRKQPAKKKWDQESFSRHIHRLIADLKTEHYQPGPLSDLPGQQGSFRDRLVQEVVAMLLEAMFEGVFSCDSHGFQPRCSCHTALLHAKHVFFDVNWLIHADLNSFFPSIDFDVLRTILRKRIMDEKFIRLINKFLRAGALNNWQFQRTYSGTPIGGIIGPILVNIYFHELDRYINELKQMPRKGTLQQTGKDQRSEYPAACKRLAYVRYAGELLIGVEGSKREAGLIRDQVAQFIGRQLKIPDPQCQLTINHAKKPTRFLGYDIMVKKNCNLYLPHDIWVGKLHRLNEVKVDQNGLMKPVHRPELARLSDPEILAVFNTEIKSMYDYYRLADNASVLSKFYYFHKYSMFKTFAFKYKKSVRKILQKYLHEGKFTVVAETNDGPKLMTLYGGRFTRNSCPIIQDDLDLIPERNR